jgi:hypothetical protein
MSARNCISTRIQSAGFLSYRNFCCTHPSLIVQQITRSPLRACTTLQHSHSRKDAAPNSKWCNSFQRRQINTMIRLTRLQKLVTRTSCLHVDKVHLQIAAALHSCHKSYHLLDSPGPSKPQSIVGTMLSNCTAPCQPTPIMDVKN